MDDERMSQTAEGYVSLRWLRQSLNLSQSQKEKREGQIPQQEYIRARFYRHYQREAEEYDREFMGKYDDDLNTTLVFVSAAHRPNAHLLTRTAGWSLFCCGFRIHHRCPFRVPTRPESGDNRSPSHHNLHIEQHRVRRSSSYGSPMDRPPTQDCPGSGDSRCQSFHFAPVCFPSNARETVVEPMYTS